MFTHILAPVKFTDVAQAERSVAIADRMAQANGAHLTLATITPHWITVKDADYSWEARRWFEARATNALQSLRTRLVHQPCRTIVRWGSVPGSILDIAEEIEADLIVLPVSQPTLTDFLQRPEAISIAARGGCSVLVVR